MSLQLKTEFLWLIIRAIRENGFQSTNATYPKYRCRSKCFKWVNDTQHVITRLRVIPQCSFRDIGRVWKGGEGGLPNARQLGGKWWKH